MYAFPEHLSFDFESLIKENLKMIPQAILGLESALKLYDLTDEAPRDIHLIVPLSDESSPLAVPSMLSSAFHIALTLSTLVGYFGAVHVHFRYGLTHCSQ